MTRSGLVRQPYEKKAKKKKSVPELEISGELCLYLDVTAEKVGDLVVESIGVLNVVEEVAAEIEVVRQR